MTRIAPLLLLAVACGSSAPEKTEPAPSKEKAKVEAPAEAEPEPVAEDGPPARGDDSTRKSKNATATHKVGDVDVTVTYGRPEARERAVWGELVPYGKVWRTGADEASVMTFSDDIMLGAARVKAGSYALFTIPDEDKWTIILNTEAGQWGSYDYDKSKDVARAIVKPRKAKEPVEAFTIESKGDNLVLAWADVMVPVPLKPAE